MGTTVTLDDDVAALLDRECRERGTSLRTVVNEALRERYRPRPQAFRTRTSNLGRARIDLGDVAEALDDAAHDDRW